MGMKDMVKGCVHTMMGKSKGSPPADAVQTLNRIINESPVVVFSKSNCPYCVDTKATLDKHNAKYKVIDMNTLDSSVVSALRVHTGQRTVPNIFIAGSHVGGNSELQALGPRLKLRLEAAGAI